MASNEENGSDEEVNENPFIDQKTFPDPAAIFSFKLKSLSDIKDDCIVVLDTNVLLVPYTISPKNLQEIKKTYSKLTQQSRLKIPAQVAREFARNRATKLTELYQQLSNKRSNIKLLHSGRYPLLESIPDYSAATELEKEIDNHLRKYQELLGNVIEQIKQWKWDDPVSLLYSDLFHPDSIIEATITENDLDKDLKMRTSCKVPPGYKDASKETNSAGDLLIWHTILNLGEKNKKSLILVSGDGKPDWWHKVNKQLLYPRFELVDEYRRASNGHSFHILKLSDFLDLFGAEESVIKEIRNKEVVFQGGRVDDYSEIRALNRNAEEAVGRWLLSQYPESEVMNNTRSNMEKGCDYIIDLKEGGRIAVDVKLFHFRTFNGSRASMEVWRRLKDLSYQAFYVKSEGNYANFIICVVFTDEELIPYAENIITNRLPSMPQIALSLGYLDSEGNYIEMTRLNDD